MDHEAGGRALAEASRRGARIFHVNPLIEAAATRTIVPHEFLQMALSRAAQTSTLNIQPRIAPPRTVHRGSTPRPSGVSPRTSSGASASRYGTSSQTPS
ncbi:hypothetical protein GCM10009838_26980 [Catenulispora subtropica]|uniref:Uncharacterized protein n=1 Tax=Catenulispora subtropica TaxID=450798 RepID=A0ABP5CQL8_9ACTN